MLEIETQRYSEQYSILSQYAVTQRTTLDLTTYMAQLPVATATIRKSVFVVDARDRRTSNGRAQRALLLFGLLFPRSCRWCDPQEIAPERQLSDQAGRYVNCTAEMERPSGCEDQRKATMENPRLTARIMISLRISTVLWRSSQFLATARSTIDRRLREAIRRNGLFFEATKRLFRRLSRRDDQFYPHLGY